jgi:hypothetical protein
LQIFNQKIWPCKKPFLAGKTFPSPKPGLPTLYTLTNPMPSDINRLTVPALAKGLHVVVKPCNLRRCLLFKEIAILAVPRSPCLQHTLLMTVQASSMPPAVPGRRVNATVPGPRRLPIISGPTGGRRCHRYGALIKRRLRVRSSRSRLGSSSGTPGSGVARELQFKSHFKGEAKFFYPMRKGVLRISACMYELQSAEIPSSTYPLCY